MRQAERDVVLGGYRIPKGTVVVMNALGQHMDQRHFPEPEVLAFCLRMLPFDYLLQQGSVSIVHRYRDTAYKT